ncbi:MAG TPA: class I SAM-dependent methyltransferase [Gammaproteobacteria bacterium]|nr:class I SAM-dependent methyltransferase [Gammaproteobacteria bacterium]
MADFKDHFSGHATAYADARPHYPAALFDWLATLTPQHDLAWDCGTGNGQAAVALAAYYTRVVATDASAQQIERAFPRQNVEYRAVPAERSDLAAHSVDLVTVAQAAHWFELPAFYAEVQRVVKPGGAIVLWCYGLCSITPELDAVVEEFYEGESKPYWPPERRLIDEAYRSLPFPFAELAPPPFTMTQHWNADQMLAYLRTWSAIQRYIRVVGHDPLAELETELRAAWGMESRQVSWPLHIRAGRLA